MKASEVYRMAAKNMENGHALFCCHAIANILDAHGIDEDLCSPMKDIFANSKYSYAWMSEDADNGALVSVGTPQHDRRILALCFMAAIAESEGN